MYSPVISAEILQAPCVSMGSVALATPLAVQELSSPFNRPGKFQTEAPSAHADSRPPVGAPGSLRKTTVLELKS